MLKDRYPIELMRGLNQEIVKFIEQLEGVEQYSTAGSFRRYKEMSKDLDFIISTSGLKSSTTITSYSK